MTLTTDKTKATPLLKHAPNKFQPNLFFAWFVGKYETDRVLAQQWQNSENTREVVWVIVPEYKNPNV
jgi:hypothetical protein